MTRCIRIATNSISPPAEICQVVAPPVRSVEVLLGYPEAAFCSRHSRYTHTSDSPFLEDDPTTTEQYVMEFSWSDVRRYHPVNVTSSTVVVATTPHRNQVIGECLEELRRHRRDFVPYTGVQGVGKSHNLVRLVLRLRAEGHVVACIHDMAMLNKVTSLLLQELLFGIEVLLRSLHPDEAAKVVSAVKGAAVLCSTHQEAPQVAAAATSMVGAHQWFKEASNDDPLQSAAVAAVVEAVRRTRPGQRVYLVVDQDEKLHAADILHLAFDGTVISGSPDNTRWRGNNHISARCVQWADPLPLSCAQLLFPDVMGDVCDTDPMCEYILTCLGGFPMCWGWAAAVARNTPDRTQWASTLQAHAEAYARDAVGRFEASLGMVERKLFSCALHGCTFDLVTDEWYDVQNFELRQRGSQKRMVPSFPALFTEAGRRFRVTADVLRTLASRQFTFPGM